MTSKPSGSCSRCGVVTSELYPYKELDEDTNEELHYLLCWDCDWDLMNGMGEMSDDVGEIQLHRAEQAYEYDPINNVRPQ